MPYTQATILEVLRRGSVISPGERVAVRDSMVDGHMYPKGTVAGIRLYDIHHSRDTWNDPDVFRPDRFLSTDGMKVQHHASLIPFGYGNIYTQPTKLYNMRKV